MESGQRRLFFHGGVFVFMFCCMVTYKSEVRFQSQKNSFAHALGE